MLAIFIFMGAALALTAFLIVTSTRTSREDQRALAAAREREERARLDAERARATRARWEARIAEDQLAAVESDPRGIDDGLAKVIPLRTGRFRRDVPAPFISG